MRFFLMIAMMLAGTRALGLGLEAQRLAQQAEAQAKSRLSPLLEKYCGESCTLLGVQTELDEVFSENFDLGFEAISGKDQASQAFVASLSVDIQLDDRTSSANRTKLETLIQNQLSALAPKIDLRWKMVSLPVIGQTDIDETKLKDLLEAKVTKVVQKAIDIYCPLTCLIERTEAFGRNITPDEAQGLSSSQKITDERGRSHFRIDRVEVDLSMDETIPLESRAKIIQMLKTKTKFVETLEFNLNIMNFPETHAELKERLKAADDDPYGLEKLRQMLILFRELAGTKEIISKSESQNMNTNSEKLDSKVDTQAVTTSVQKSEINSEKNTNSSINESKNSKESSESSSTASQESLAGLSKEELAIYGGLIGLLLIVILVLGLRFAGAQRSAQEMVLRANGNGTGIAKADGEGVESQSPPQAKGGEAYDLESTRAKLRRNELRDRLMQQMLEHPRVAKETFGRLLKEDGVEVMARYVKILGQVVIFQLIEDVALQREIYQLSEYYHHSEFKMSLEEECQLLEKLEVRMTAAEIKVLSARGMDRFDFLSKLEVQQIHKLISDESQQLQAVVIAHLEPKKRSQLFDYFQGRAKLDLLQELSKTQAVPKEYLQTVARALQRKLNDRPEFDTQSINVSGLLLDLVEKARFEEQRQILGVLNTRNPEAAKALKQQLTSVEMLAHMKDGHLLELIMGIDRQELLAFLGGVSDNIRNLLLRKAPEELAESWREDLSLMPRVEEKSYKNAEALILSRIKVMAQHGVLSLFDLNNAVFAPAGMAANKTQAIQSVPGKINPQALVA